MYYPMWPVCDCQAGLTKAIIIIINLKPDPTPNTNSNPSFPQKSDLLQCQHISSTIQPSTSNKPASMPQR